MNSPPPPLSRVPEWSSKIGLRLNPRNREERENVCVIRMRWVLGSPKGYEIEMGLYGTGKKTGIQDDMGEGGGGTETGICRNGT